ncbi:hypothetical protein NU219Hw_g5940t1 [Hortaea werneckii]
MSLSEGSQAQATSPSPPPDVERPELPPRSKGGVSDTPGLSAHSLNSSLNVPPPPQRKRTSFGGEDIASPIHCTRDPHRLVAYLVRFPKPELVKAASEVEIPDRFLIYTPPPPPLSKPKENEKEGQIHKVQRKWEEEIREAKTSDAETMSWKGLKGKATKGINWGISKTKTSNAEFLNRMTPGGGSDKRDDNRGEDSHEDEHAKPTVKLEELMLIYPSSMPKDPDQLRQEFVNTMLRSKSKAEKDAIVATGLLPVSFAIDTLATLVWPFGGLLEIDAVWAYASIRGAKTSRSVTKRLASTSETGDHDKDKLTLNFTPSARLALLEKYLAARCHEREPKLFPYIAAVPTETEILEAIGWSPSQIGSEKNWKDEAWEVSEVKEDLKSVMAKGAKEWGKWCHAFEKEPEKALKK